MATLLPYKGGTAGVKLPIDQPVFKIGRGPSNDLCVDDDLVSREHAIIERTPSATQEDAADYVIRDLNSTNGTFVNHERVDSRLLQSGDMVRIGKSFLLFSKEEVGEPDPTATLKLHKTFIPGVYYTKGKDEPENKE